MGVEHGATELPTVTVAGYNAEIRDAPGSFLGDRANDRAFHDIIEELRSRLRQLGDDPLGDRPSVELGKKALDKVLKKGPIEAKGLIEVAADSFSRELAGVIRRFLAAEPWRGTEHLVIGGGMSWSLVGEMVVARTAVLLKAGGIDVRLSRIRHPSDEAGLVGAVQLTQPGALEGFDAILAVDIGGTKMRAGVVALHLEEAPGCAAACVWKNEVWRHADAEPTRDEAVARLADMLKALAEDAERAGLRLAPFIGVGCPGLIHPDGRIDRGAQNLPGNWESPRFNLPQRLREAIPRLGGRPTVVVLHNDAVVQGLSEVPYRQDVRRWGIFTIGTGFGNAVFRNRARTD